ncbi:MAG: type III-B CRISPR module RAMP protein Cmr4 [Oligoflexia bacterium]|nr:type III-B CRISPR module RAMP protein Cmr4 [Oligoflexia bacterium]
MSQPMLCGVLTLTPTHCGTGQASGAVDLPIAREAHTRLPVLPASTLKGVVRDWFGQPADGTDAYKAVKTLFGPRPLKRKTGTSKKTEADEDEAKTDDQKMDDQKTDDQKTEKTVNLQAGDVVFLEGMLLAFPVRSLTGVYRMVTSPMLIQRLRRLMLALGTRLPSTFTCPVPGEGSALLPSKQSGPISLEDRVFSSARCSASDQVDTLAKWLGRFVSREVGDSDRAALAERLVVVPDETLQDLALRGTQVSARIVLNHKHKTSDNLWYEETLPPDTLFAVVMADRPGTKRGPTDKLREALPRHAKVKKNQRYGQLGGNVTVGQGLVRWTLDVDVEVKQ